MEKNLVVANIGMKFGMCHLEGAMSYGAEIAAICDSDEENLRAAGERYAHARRMFSEATDPDLIEALIYEMKIAESRYCFLLKKAKEDGLTRMRSAR